MENKRHLDCEMAVRRLVGSLMSQSVLDGPRGRERESNPDSVSGLAVPPASARDVIAVACRVAADGSKSGPWPSLLPATRLIAEAMVVDEHPSVREWTTAERQDVLHWTTLIIHRFGEDGVQRLVDQLGGRR
jgi:hypothetical protein